MARTDEQKAADKAAKAAIKDGRRANHASFKAGQQLTHEQIEEFHRLRKQGPVEFAPDEPSE